MTGEGRETSEGYVNEQAAAVGTGAQSHWAPSGAHASELSHWKRKKGKEYTPRKNEVCPPGMQALALSASPRADWALSRAAQKCPQVRDKKLLAEGGTLTMSLGLSGRP